MKHAILLMLLGMMVLVVGCQDSATPPREAADQADEAEAEAAAVVEEVEETVEEAVEEAEASEISPPIDEPGTYVYRGKSRDQAWFNTMYERYCNQTAKIDDEFFDVGDDQVLPASIKHAQRGTWAEVHDAEVKEVLSDPVGYKVNVRRHAYRTSDMEPLDELPEETNFDIYLDESSEERMRGDEFEEHIVCISSRHFVIHRPVTREEFAQALRDGFILIRYQLNEDGTIDKSYEE